MEQRQYPRFPVQFHSSFSSANIIGGEGQVVDLSFRGCRIASSASIQPGTTLELRIHVSDNEPPISIDQAVVRWCKTKHSGLEFMKLQPAEWARLQQVVKDIELEPYQRPKAEETPPG